MDEKTRDWAETLRRWGAAAGAGGLAFLAVCFLVGDVLYDMGGDEMILIVGGAVGIFVAGATYGSNSLRQ